MARKESFTINGVTYDSLDAIPEPERSRMRNLLADDDGDGVPDIVQGGHPATINATTASVRIDRNEFVVDGVAYDSLDDMPEPHRSLIQRELADALAAGGYSSIGTSAAPTVPTSSHAPVVSRAGWSNRSKLLAAFVVVDLAVIALVVVVLTR